MTFDPRCPPTSNSLNRLRLEAAALPDILRGKRGYELLSTQALNTLIRPYTGEVAEFYQQAALDADWAIALARLLGQSLGGLLLALIRSDAQTHQANPDKPAAYWTHWSTIQRVYLGGGLVRGKVGEIIAAQAQATVQSLADEPGFQVIRAEHPQYLPLLGAARTVPAGHRASLLDFGSSYVKRAIAHYTQNGLSRLQIRESLPNEFPSDSVDARFIFARMVDIIVQAYTEVDTPIVPISVASYVSERGQPLLTQAGAYMSLAQLTPDVPAALSQAASDRLGTAVEVRLLHDGTAAALYYAPMEQAAVIMLGTALGCGYPVSRPGLALCPVAPTLVVG